MKNRFLQLISLLLLILSFQTVPAFAKSADVWDGTSIVEPTETRTINGETYYEISTCAELAFIAQTDDWGWDSENYILTNDLILNEEEIQVDEEGFCTNGDELNLWIPIERFYGKILGDGHTVSGMYVVYDDYYAGFISDLSGSVHDLHFENSYVQSSDPYTAGIAGSIEAYANDFDFGIFDCSFDGIVNGATGTGSIVGYLWVNGERYYDDPSTFPIVKVSNCTFDGEVYATSSYAGGIIGVLNGKWATVYVENCVNNGDIYGTVEVGGIVGQLLNVADMSVRIDSCENNGDIYASNQTAGGIIGIVYGIGDNLVQYCTNNGQITSAQGNVGGIAGTLSTRDNYGHNDYYKDKNIARGYHEVRYCINTGDLEARYNCGGLVGGIEARNEGEIWVHDSYSTGDISGTNSGTLTATANMYPDSEFLMECCYSVGTLTGESRLGGLISDVRYNDCTNAPKFRSCYWLETMAADAVGTDAAYLAAYPVIEDCEGLSANELKKESSFDGFDFDKIWYFDDSDGYEYPRLTDKPITGMVDDAFDWEWSAASKTITIIPEASPNADYAIVGQYKDGKMVSVFFFDLNDDEQTAQLKDPDSNKNKLFLLDDDFNPID